MPYRYIPGVDDVVLVDENGCEMGKTVSRDDVIKQIVNSNPLFIQSYKNVAAAHTISQATAKSLGKTLKLTQEDWDVLKQALDAPKVMTTLGGQPQIVPGFGYHPMVTQQLLPILRAIAEATATAPSNVEGEDTGAKETGE